MRLLQFIHNVATCYFMLAPIAVDGRHSPPSCTSDDFSRLRQSATSVISLLLLLAPVAVDAGFEECPPPTGVQPNPANEREYMLTPTKDGISALFSVGYNQPLVVHTAEKFMEGSVEVHVSNDDCYLSLLAAISNKKSQFTPTRWCPPFEEPTFSTKPFYAQKLVVTFNKQSVEYAQSKGSSVKDDTWNGFKPYAENEKEGWTLWNLTFRSDPTGKQQQLTIYMDKTTVKFKCFFLDTTPTASTTTETSTINSSNSLHPGATGSGGGRGGGGTPEAGTAGIAGLKLWELIVVIVAGFIIFSIVIACIVIGAVCYVRKKKRKAHSGRPDDKSQKTEQKAKPVEGKKEPTDLERWEAYAKHMDRSTKTARPMRPLKPVDQMRHDWYEKKKKTNSFRKQFPKWEEEHMRKHPDRYRPPLWDCTDRPTEREEIFEGNCHEIEVWIK
ncbi:hypothetical protein AAVH_39864, partial [Aphelenchoides avenae]